LRKIPNYVFAVIVGLVVVVILAGALVLQPESVAQTGATFTATNVSSSTPESPTVEFSLTVQDANTPFTFVYNSQDNPTLYVHKGDTVKVTLTNTGTQRHDFTLQGYNIKTSVLNPGQSDSIVFKADTTGTFTYYCSVPGHKDLGMQGQLIVQ
jgi:nitrite reductase (NO-forming)